MTEEVHLPVSKCSAMEPHLDILENDEEGDAEDDEPEPEISEHDEDYALLLGASDSESTLGIESDHFPDAATLPESDDNWNYASEQALGSDQIIQDLPSDVFPYTSAQQPRTSLSGVSLDLNLPSSSNLPSSLVCPSSSNVSLDLPSSDFPSTHEVEAQYIDNERAVAWRQLMLAEDQTARYVRELMDLGVDEAQLADHLSQAVLSRICKPAAEVLSMRHERQAIDELDTRALKKAKFERQRKEARKESYGFR